MLDDLTAQNVFDNIKVEYEAKHRITLSRESVEFAKYYHEQVFDKFDKRLREFAAKNTQQQDEIRRLENKLKEQS